MTRRDGTTDGQEVAGSARGRNRARCERAGTRMREKKEGIVKALDRRGFSSRLEEGVRTGREGGESQGVGRRSGPATRRKSGRL